MGKIKLALVIAAILVATSVGFYLGSQETTSQTPVPQEPVPQWFAPSDG